MAVEAPTRLTPGAFVTRRKSKLAAFHGPFSTAARRVRNERALSLALFTLAIPIALSVAWVGLIRFTLLDLPQWPALLPIIVWALAVFVFRARIRVSTGQAARYLDHALSLDEALSTYVEMISRRSQRGQSRMAGSYVQSLGDSILHSLKTRSVRLPRANVKLSRGQSVGIVVTTCLLALVIIAPTPLDAVRLERQKLAQSISAQLQRVAELRADLVSRPQIPDATRSALLAELDRLEAELKTPGVDQASVLAAISDTQERLRQLSPDLTSDFDPLIQAAQKVEDTITRNSTWLATSSARTEIGRAADASDFFSNYIITKNASEAFGPGFTKASQSSSALGFESASGLVATRDAALARLLQDTSSALRDKTLDPAAKMLITLAAELRTREGRQQAAEAVEHALSSLDDGKQSIAQTTETKQKKQQVGFRRGQPDSAASTATAVAGGGKSPIVGTPGANSTSQAGDGSQSGSTSPGAPTRISSSANTGLGANMPGGPPPGSSQSQSQSSKPGSSDGQQSDDSSGGTQKSGQAGGQTGGTPQSGQSDGKLSGPVTGPSGGVTGGITKVENPEGVGISQGDSPKPNTGDGSQDSVSLPVNVSGTGGDTGAEPTPGAQPQGSDSGAVGIGGSGKKSDQIGGGAATTIRTPFTEVIGKYAQIATAALERAYIPQDAKEYVRDYFTELGK